MRDNLRIASDWLDHGGCEAVMSDYALTETDIVIRSRDGANVPNDPENRDRADYDKWLAAGGVPDPYVAPPAPPPSILSQHLIAQFTAADAGAIQSAISGNTQFWLLWSAMQAQKDPMIVTNARFLAGWTALITVLGAPRMAAIATALGVSIT
jgi:hypothetical protein